MRRDDRVSLDRVLVARTIHVSLVLPARLLAVQKRVATRQIRRHRKTKTVREVVVYLYLLNPNCRVDLLTRDAP